MKASRLWRDFKRLLVNTPPGVRIICGLLVFSFLGLLILKAAFGSLGETRDATEPTVYDIIVERIVLIPGDIFRLGPQGLVTLILLHDGVFHLLLNVLVIFSLGPWVERAIGFKRFLLLCLISTLSGSILQVFFSLTIGNPDAQIIGASGMAVGVLSGFAVLYPDARVHIWFTAPIRAASLLLLVPVLDLVFLLMRAPIAVAVHLGGLISAVAYVRRPWSAARAKRLLSDLWRRS